MLQVDAVYACDNPYAATQKIVHPVMSHSVCQVKIQHSQAEDKKIPTPSHLFTNLAYKLKPHQRRNQYLRERLDTCADVNIMPASVYKLVFNDLELKMLAPTSLKIGTYTTDTEDIGCFPGPPYCIQIDWSVTSKQTSCRPILMHLKEAFQQEIDKMLKVGVLKPVHEATPWINSFVLVEGEGQAWQFKIENLLGPHNLKKAIVREPHPFKTLEDIAYLFTDVCIMSVCNCKKGYWDQELDESSSFLITFNTELGTFRYTMIPFGATVAGDIFQYKLEQCFGHLRNVIVIADNIMIVGKKPCHSNHDQALTTLLETARKCNVQLNYDRLQYKKQEVNFIWWNIHYKWSQARQNKVTTITKMSAPTNKMQVQSPIGMINYLLKFSARLSEIAKAIQELAKDKVPFNWGPEHQSAFTQMMKQ